MSPPKRHSTIVKTAFAINGIGAAIKRMNLWLTGIRRGPRRVQRESASWATNWMIHLRRRLPRTPQTQTWASSAF